MWFAHHRHHGDSRGGSNWFGLEFRKKQLLVLVWDSRDDVSETRLILEFVFLCGTRDKPVEVDIFTGLASSH